MHSLDVFPVPLSPAGESPSSYEDSASSEGVPTPLEGPASHLNVIDHSADAPLSIHIPKKISRPPIGTPFITDSTALFEYPFPPVSPRPPLSSTSSSSSISSTPGPPSSAALDKHSSHVFARLSSRVGPVGHRRTSSHGGLSPIPIPPRLRKPSGGSIFDDSTPTQHDTLTRFDLSPRADNSSNHTPPNRDHVAARPTSNRACSSPRMAGYELGPALVSAPRACMDPMDRRRSMPAVLTDEDDGYVSASEEPRVKI